MDKNEMIAQLTEIIRPYVKEKAALENVSDSTDFLVDLKINSANLVDVILDIEEAFDIEIDNDSMQKMLTIGEALQIIERKLAEK